MVAILNLLTLVAAATASVLPRDAAGIQTDLKTIDTDTNALTSQINSWNGQAGSALGIQNAESKLEGDLKTANTNAGKSAVISSADAKTIIAYIQNTLEPDIVKTTTALGNKKAQFKSSGLYSTVQKDLKNLKNLTDVYGATLVTKTPSDQKSNAQTLINKIDADFNAAIQNFS